MSKQRVSYYQCMFYSAALFNWSAATSFIIGFQDIYTFMGGGSVPQEPIFNLLLQLLSSIVALFGAVYFFIGRNPNTPSARGLIVTAMVGKLLFVCFFTGYAITGLTPWGFVGLVFVDFVYAVLFFEFLRFQSSTATVLNH